jgi:heat shock protein HslJ
MKNPSLLLTAIFTLIAFLSAACSPASPAVVGEWRLVSYGDASKPAPALPGVEASISFGENGQFGGNVGCNGFGAEYKVSGDEIAFDGIVSTMMYCEATAAQESGVLGVLSNSPLKFDLDGDTLTLTSADGASVVVLARR